MKRAKSSDHKSKIRLGINIDHAATLRQVRGGTTEYPDLLEIVKRIKSAGAHQITVHLREDRRHIQLSDVKLLCKERVLPVNLEMAVNPSMLKIARKFQPEWVCLVPEKRAELTTEGGLNVIKGMAEITKTIEKLQAKGIEVSTFIEPSIEQVQASFRAGADAVEFHTGRWVHLKGEKKKKEWSRLVAAARAAFALGLRVHAGHGLDYQHAEWIRQLPHLVEVNIGHSIICYSISEGIQLVTRKMLKCLKP